MIIRTNRRDFLKKAALIAAAGPFIGRSNLVRGAAYKPARIRGKIASGSKGLAGVRVTDGASVVLTDSEGGYELIADANRPFVYFSVPNGYKVPVSKNSTAAFYQRIRPNAAGEAEVSFELEPQESSNDRHTFFLLADPQTQDTFETGRMHAETVPDLIQSIKDLGEVPSFAVGCGDLMFDDLTLYPEYERAAQRTGIPFFQVVGNHDMNYEGKTDEQSTTTFEDHFGPRYYSFDRGEVHYVILDDVFWSGAHYLGYIDDIQLRWLAQDLATVEQGRTVVVCQHIPAYCTYDVREGQKNPSPSNSITNREALYALLAPYKNLILSGHNHETEHVFQGGTHEIVNGAVCGAWWSGDICNDGTPNGYGIYTVQGSDIHWAYKATGQTSDYQMRVYAPGAVPDNPKAILANVWNWDPEWKVFWYVNGERKGEMTQVKQADPLSVEQHAGPDKPARRTWVDPHPTEHMFVAEPTSQDVSIIVEAVDRFGTKYTGRVEGGPKS